jgi:hypothetical protein
MIGPYDGRPGQAGRGLLRRDERGEAHLCGD